MATLRIIDVDACTLAIGRADALLNLLSEFYSDMAGPLLPALDTIGRELAEVERLLIEADEQPEHPAHDHHNRQPDPDPVTDAEQHLLTLYRQMTDEQKAPLLTVARTMARRGRQA